MYKLVDSLSSSSIVWVLTSLVNKEGPLDIDEIYVGLYIDPDAQTVPRSSIYRYMEELERGGFVSVFKDSSKPRLKRYLLTEKGWELVREFHKRVTHLNGLLTKTKVPA